MWPASPEAKAHARKYREDEPELHKCRYSLPSLQRFKMRSLKFKAKCKLTGKVIGPFNFKLLADKNYTEFTIGDPLGP